MKTREIRQEYLTGERALFQGANLKIYDSIFADGESPLKESHDIELEGCMLKWKYPFWYAKNITARNCTWFEMARVGVWYTDNIKVEDAVIEAPKNFRRCRGVTLRNVNFSNAAETLWSCENVELDHVTAKGDYFAMNSRDMVLWDFKLVGNYSFDGVKNMEIHNARMLTKDAFWNSENVTVYDSFISGEYLGWNAKNLTLINCTIESLQGMCYIDNLVMKNCKLLNTTLAFEYSTVDAEITGKIDSVMNPSGGVIRAGLLTGMGSSVADCIYAGIGAFGLTMVSDFLLEYQTVIHLVGGAIVLLMGIRLLFRKGEEAEIPAVSGRWKMFLSSFAVGITNPAAILTFLFAFSWFGITEGSTSGNGWLVVLGVLIGTYLWWGGLSAAVALARKRKKTGSFHKMNRIFGTVLSLFGILVFIRALPK